MSKLKIAVIGALVLLSFLCLAFLGYWAWKGYARVQNRAAILEAYQNGDWETANRLLKAVVRRDPGNEEAYRLLAETAEKRQDFWNAIWHWGRVAALNPLDPEAISRQGQAMLQAGQYRMALQLLNPRQLRGELTTPDRINLCEALTSAQNLEAARKLYDTLTAEGADTPQLRLCHADLLRQEGKLPEAEAIFATYTGAQEPAAIRRAAEIGLGDIAVARHDNDTALKHYQAAYTAQPERGNWLLGRFYFSIGQLEEAQNYLEQELNLHPYQYVAAAELGEIYAARHLADELKLLRKSLTVNQKAALETGYYLDAMDAYLRQDFPAVNQKLLWAESFRVRAFYQLMKLSADIGEKNIANLPHDVKTMLDDNDTPEHRARIVSMLLPLLSEVLSAARMDDIRMLNAILEPLVLPNTPEAFLLQETGMITSFTATDYRMAALAAAEVLKRTPESANAREILAVSLYESGQYDASLALLPLLPATRENLMRRITALRLTGQAAAARELLLEQRRQSPDDPELFDALIEVLLALQAYDEAEALAESLPDTPQERYARHLALAHIHAARGLTDAAREDYGRCIEALAALPATPEIEYQMAYLYALTDHNLEAAALYEKLLQTDPKWPLVLVNLSEVKAALGDIKGGMRHALEAQRLYPEWEAAQQCLLRRQQESREAWEKELAE